MRSDRDAPALYTRNVSAPVPSTFQPLPQALDAHGKVLANLGVGLQEILKFLGSEPKTWEPGADAEKLPVLRLQRVVAVVERQTRQAETILMMAQQVTALLRGGFGEG